MFLKFFGLQEEPFGVTPDPRFLYLGRGHREALASLEYGIRAARGFIALVAKPGLGKTILLFHLLERYANVARTAFLFQTQCNSQEFMRYLLGDLGFDVWQPDFVQVHEKLNKLLVREASAGKSFIVVVDEAQNLAPPVLETVRLLSNFETPRAKLLQIILAGQPELADKLVRPELAQLRQRVSALIRLEPFTAAETGHYIDHRLHQAGYRGGQLFTPEARKIIAARSEGIPRMINHVCFNALSLGYAMGRKVINTSIVREVTLDLDFESVVSNPRAGHSPAVETGTAPADSRGVPAAVV